MASAFLFWFLPDHWNNGDRCRPLLSSESRFLTSWAGPGMCKPPPNVGSTSQSDEGVRDLVPAQLIGLGVCLTAHDDWEELRAQRFHFPHLCHDKRDWRALGRGRRTAPAAGISPLGSCALRVRNWPCPVGPCGPLPVVMETKAANQRGGLQARSAAILPRAGGCRADRDAEGQDPLRGAL